MLLATRGPRSEGLALGWCLAWEQVPVQKGEMEVGAELPRMIRPWHSPSGQASSSLLVVLVAWVMRHSPHSANTRPGSLPGEVCADRSSEGRPHWREGVREGKGCRWQKEGEKREGNLEERGVWWRGWWTEGH